MSKTTPAGAVASVPGPRIYLRSYLSSHHLRAAKHFADQAAAFEAAFGSGSIVDRNYPPHRAAVIAAVFAAVAFLEAAINEVLKDAADSHRSYVPRWSKATLLLLAEEWRMRSQSPILDKYAAVWLLVKKRRFDRGSIVCQKAQLAIHLRNALMHFVPMTQAANEPPTHRLGQLRHEFLANPLMAGMGNPYFPDHCLGSGCATWSWRVCRTFADRFFRGIRVRANFRRLGL